MKTQLQEQHDFKRKQYMENEISHKEFYLWLADSIGITVSDLPVPIEKIRASHDEHLNDITLRLWDAKDPIVRGKAVRAGMRSWSLSDTVCVLKNFARRWPHENSRESAYYTGTLGSFERHGANRVGRAYRLHGQGTGQWHASSRTRYQRTSHRSRTRPDCGFATHCRDALRPWPARVLPSRIGAGGSH